jgi:hypothetical protein
MPKPRSLFLFREGSYSVGLSKLKKSRGNGFGSPGGKNKDLLFKWIWSLSGASSSKWQSFILEK